MDAKMALKKVAEQHGTSEREVKKEIARCIKIAANDPDPAVRARWDAIPRRGRVLTVEELIEYIASQVQAVKFQ